ncbi:hypothetical protein HAX54_008964 [Datura stramonium]|uniref:DCD domain-containing protein n=1 Tax=Datura stramonium TaxID=4076 RepID=A0ABS8RW15_DATST|nr:hypothetical protein [Datura stramonium]
MENNNQSSFWQFSDQLRLQNNNLANLSLNDSIWSSNYGSKRPEDRRNFDIRGLGKKFGKGVLKMSLCRDKVKNNRVKESNKDANSEKQNSVDKRFKTLPPAESLPRNETIGGYIFVCNNDTMAENLKRSSLACHHVTGTQLDK